MPYADPANTTALNIANAALGILVGGIFLTVAAAALCDIVSRFRRNGGSPAPGARAEAEGEGESVPQIPLRKVS